jgi:plastocyanin
MIRRVTPACAALILVLAAPVGASTLDIGMVDNAYDNPNVVATLGDNVRWANNGAHTHSTTGNSPLHLWSIDVSPSQNRTRTFRQAGTYPFHCRFHSSMVGSVKVPMQTSDPTPAVNQVITLTVATVSAPAAYTYLIQRKAPGGTFQAWKTITTRTTHFKTGTAGTWRFRARLKRISNGAKSGWSPTLNVDVFVFH